MKTVFYNFSSTLFKIFSGKNLVLQIIAFVSTFFLVVSGIDWAWYQYFKTSPLYSFFFPGAGIVGFILPLAIPFSMLVIGRLRNKAKIKTNAYGILQAVIIGWCISVFYKTLTGRPGPEMGHFISPEDISRIFRFGILEGGIFWGWPSSHTAVAFALATCITVLYSTNKKVLTAIWIFAIYVGFGAAISFHWLSDFVAGVILGSITGLVVGKSFLNKRRFL